MGSLEDLVLSFIQAFAFEASLKGKLNQLRLVLKSCFSSGSALASLWMTCGERLLSMEAVFKVCGTTSLWPALPPAVSSAETGEVITYKELERN